MAENGVLLMLGAFMGAGAMGMFFGPVFRQLERERNEAMVALQKQEARMQSMLSAGRKIAYQDRLDLAGLNREPLRSMLDDRA